MITFFVMLIYSTIHTLISILIFYRPLIEPGIPLIYHILLSNQKSLICNIDPAALYAFVWYR